MPTDPDFVAPAARSSRILRCLCLLLAAAIVFQLHYLGTQPLAAGLVPAPWDKLAHLVVYSAITALLWIGTGGGRPVLVIAAVIVIGALDELHQAQVPGRQAGVDDFITDVGAGIGTTLALQFHACSKKHDL